MRGEEREGTTVLRFATIFDRKSDARLRTLVNDCGRLRTIANACVHKRNDLASPPGPLDPNLKTGTLLLRIREKTLNPNPHKQGDSEVIPKS